MYNSIKEMRSRQSVDDDLARIDEMLRQRKYSMQILDCLAISRVVKEYKLREGENEQAKAV